MPRRFELLPITALMAATAVACESPPSASEARDWTAADHDRVEEQSRAASGQSPGQVPQAANGKGNDVVILATWRNQCAQCHGLEGHGDGPTGRMLNATDFSQSDFQTHRTDAELAAAIKNGKGKMPKFDLPDAIVRGLVTRIRMVRGG